MVLTKSDKALAKLSKHRLSRLGIKIQLKDISSVEIISSRDVGNFNGIHEDTVNVMMTNGDYFIYRSAPMNEFTLPIGPDLEVILIKDGRD